MKIIWFAQIQIMANQKFLNVLNHHSLPGVVDACENAEVLYCDGTHRRNTLSKSLKQQGLIDESAINEQANLDTIIRICSQLKSYDTKRPFQRNGRFFGVKTRGQKCSCILTQPAPDIGFAAAQVQLIA